MRRLLFLLFILISGNSIAQFRMTGEYRPRFEYRHGYKVLADSNMTAARFVSQRTRLNLFYNADKIRTGLSIQDVRTWGSQSQQNISDGLISLHEGWFEYAFTEKFSMKAGRQQLVYNDHRIMGNSDWNHQGRSHDVLVLKWTDSLLVIHTGLGYNQAQEQSNTTLYPVSNNYKAIQYFWLNRKFGATQASLLFLNNGIQSPVSSNSIRYSQVTGVHLERQKEKWSTIVKGYYQSGREGTSNKKLNAWNVGAELHRKLEKGFSVGVGLELFSGQSQTDTAKSYTDTQHSFTPPYGTGHKFNGYMDYFYAGSLHAGVGLQNGYLRLKYKNEKLFVALEPHVFLAAADVLNKSEFVKSGKYTAMDAYLGTEADFTIGWTPQKNVTFQAGYSQMFASSTMEAVKTGRKDESSNWAYLMITVKPDFIK